VATVVDGDVVGAVVVVVGALRHAERLIRERALAGAAVAAAITAAAIVRPMAAPKTPNRRRRADHAA
jgi:hypothetical protein